MKTETKKTPTLRFPEFDGDWREKKVVDFAPLQRGFDLPSYEVIEGDYPVVYSNGILKTHNEYRAEAPGIVTGRSGTIGKVTFVEENYWAHNTTLWVTDFKGNNPKYIYYFYTNFKLERYGTGSGVPTLNRNDVHSQKILVPTINEQEKIASFLTSIDKKIEQLTEKKDLLEKYKKGVVQKIFSQEIRFKNENGKDFVDWEEKKIGEITSVSAGATPSTLNKSYWDGDVRWMNSGELNLKRVYEVENRITQLGLKNSSTKIIPKYCILIGLAGQGKTRGTVAMNMIELCTNQSIAAIHPNKEKFVEDFLYQNLDTRYDELRSLSTGDGGRGGLNLQIIKSLEINLPAVQEQQKIADFLSAIDDKINLVNQELEKTQEYKKGLLQQMFV